MAEAGEKPVDEFRELIKNLRVRMEKSVDELKRLEEKGGQNSGELALWSAHYVWNSEQYSDLEKKLKEKGCK